MKTNPIGVRFDRDILEDLRQEYGIESPQKALNFLSDYWVSTKNRGVDEKDSLNEGDSPADIVVNGANIGVENTKEGEIKPLDDIGQNKAKLEPLVIDNTNTPPPLKNEAHSDEYYMEIRNESTSLEDIKKLWDMICRDPDMPTYRKRNWEVELQIKKLNL